MKLNSHINYLSNKLNEFEIFIKKLLPSIVSLQTKIILWYIFIRSVLLYGMEIILLFPKCYFNKLEKLYNKSLRITLNTHSKSNIDNILVYLK